MNPVKHKRIPADYKYVGCYQEDGSRYLDFVPPNLEASYKARPPKGSEEERKWVALMQAETIRVAVRPCDDFINLISLLGSIEDPVRAVNAWLDQ